MKKVLITGGSGTVGTAFIERYYDKYKFFSYSRNEKMQVALKREYEDVEIILGAIEDKYQLISTFLKVKPDIVIHAAAMKHVDTGEKQPIKAILTNVVGTLNVIEASLVANVPVSVGISTDKACSPDNVYGYTKSLMEKMYLEINNEKNRFICCRFGNVAGSHGSVIPYWFRLLETGQPLKLTDPDMNRLMFLPKEAAALIEKAIVLGEEGKGGIILSKKMKSVNMLEMAISVLKFRNIPSEKNNIEIIGKRPGEKLDEDLISMDELKHAYTDGDYIMLDPCNVENFTRELTEEVNSNTAEKMSDVEMEEILVEVEKNISKTLLNVRQY